MKIAVMKILIIVAACIAATYGNMLGLKLKKCPRDSPRTVKCILKAVDALRPSLKKGIPALHIPRIDPFKMKYIELEAERPGLILRGDASNIVARGAGNFKLKDIKIDFQNYFVELSIHIPQLTVTADYNTHGSKLYLLSINGSGQFKGTFTDVTAVAKISAHPIIRNGVEYAKLDDITMVIEFGNGILDCTPDDSTIKAKTAAKFIKENSNTVLQLMSPVINKAAGPIVMKYASKIVNTVPLRDLFI